MAKTTFSPPCGQLLRALCSWFRECNSPLCPLDPDLEQKSPPKLTPFCFWYLKAATLDGDFEIPSHMYGDLIRYVVHLSELGDRNPDLLKIPRHAHRIAPRIDDLGKVRGIV